MLAHCVAEVGRLDPQPDLVVLTGDLADLGRPEEYEHLRAILSPLRQRIVAVPGNHDRRDAMRAAFPDCGYEPSGEFLQFVLDDYPLRVIGLDTQVPGQDHGELCRERLDWLQAVLAARPERPTVILMHHPPFLTGIGHMDRIALSSRAAFAQAIARHPQVELVLCGHVHRSIRATVGGRPVLICPSPAHQVALDLREDAPSRFRLEPPGFMLHRWADGALVSHIACIGDYPGPFPFYEPDGQLIGSS
jgi:3',5'-cyclic AMP phosphodiesterase CpdA